MFTKAQEIDPRLIRHHTLFDHVAKDLIHGLGLPGRPLSDIAKRIKAKFDLSHFLSSHRRSCVPYISDCAAPKKRGQPAQGLFTHEPRPQTTLFAQHQSD